jgi:hypothetical protein
MSYRPLSPGFWAAHREGSITLAPLCSVCDRGALSGVRVTTSNGFPFPETSLARPNTCGRGDRNRTCCLMLPKHALYHVSYTPMSFLVSTYKMVSVGRLELPASCTPSMRSTNLSYTLMLGGRRDLNPLFHAFTAHGLDSSPSSTVLSLGIEPTSAAYQATALTNMLREVEQWADGPVERPVDIYEPALFVNDFGRRGGSRTRMLLVPNQAAYHQAFAPS